MADQRLCVLRIPLLLVLVLAMAGTALGQPVPIPQRGEDDGEEGPRLLDDEQINHIKVYEVLLENEPDIRFSNEDLEEFLEEYSADERVPRGREDRRAFMRAEGYQQLGLMFDLRARAYYGKGIMRGDPESMAVWHREVHRRYIIEYFRDHFGSGQVEALYLFPRGREQDRVSYTNFYILTQVSVDGVPMIDRNNPDESLILQWGLEREDAKYPAPEVPGWEPYFRGTDDERFVKMLNWVKTLVADQNSNYGLDYRVPNNRRPAPPEGE